MRKFELAALFAFGSLGLLNAANVTVTMNTVSTTMSLADKNSGEQIEVGTPENKIYNFEAPKGEYILTAYGKDETTVNGTIEIAVSEDVEQSFTICTPTAYSSTKTNGTTWTIDNGDYTLDVRVVDKEGISRVITVGNSVTSGRKTFPVLNGDTYFATFTPSEAHQAEGYMETTKRGTVTGIANISAAFPIGADYTVTIPAEAEFSLGIKYTNFIPFTVVNPTSIELDGDSKLLTYHLANSQVYNFRTWKPGGLTQAGYFTMSTDEANRPTLAFTNEDYETFGVNQVEHSTAWNTGYETGNIFVNINERGHLKMNVGDTFMAHAMRSWELTDGVTNNYFIEPDFHYTVIDCEGNPSSDVITIENADTTTDPWSKITAIGNGTVIVLVTYDAINLNYYKKAVKTPFVGGENWSAIWPENTTAYVVTVGTEESNVVTNMLLNEGVNNSALKNAGDYVDAEHDVFYYLDSEEGAEYTFSPENVASIEIAYPVIGEKMATYTGFTTEGVTYNGEDSYTLLLKEGRQIVRLTDANGNATYQVLTAKPCHQEITNLTHENSEIFYPGDEVKIQYSGLQHPANKMAGVYNMSAFITYDGMVNGSELTGTPSQYTFGSASSAQEFTVTIPEDFDVDTNPYYTLDNGMIQVSGYGDPIGNHRLISYELGRNANFTAASHQTYFGSLPAITLAFTNNSTPSGVDSLISDALSPVRYFSIDGKELSAPQTGITIIRHADGSVTKVLKH